MWPSCYKSFIAPPRSRMQTLSNRRAVGVLSPAVQLRSARTCLSMFFDTSDFVRRPLPVLARLIDDGSGEQLGRIELADSESFEPCLLSTREAMKLCAPDVPQLDVHAIGAALAEQEGGHGSV